MNKTLLELHNEPIDIYEEQKQLKNTLAQNRIANTQSRELKNANVSVHSIILEHQDSAENLMQQMCDLIKNRQNEIEKLKDKLLVYLQEKEHYLATLPSSHRMIRLLEDIIIPLQRAIERRSESMFELQKQLSLLEANASMPIEIFDTHLSPNEMIDNAYEGINQLREKATVFSQSVADQEQYNAELKQRLENYAQMVETLNHDPMGIDHETLVQAFENVVLCHAEVAEEYLGIFEEIAISFPKMLCDFANTIQNHIDGMVYITQIMDKARDLNAETRDRKIVRDILNGSLGKYMEGDLPYINYLNFIGEMSVLDMKYVSEEVQAGKVKDRGVTELINLLQEHDIQIPYKDAFQLRLLLVEHHKVVEVSTKNNKLDYIKNYLNQHKSLSDKAITIGATASAPLRNPSELKILIHNILEQYSGDNGYARDAMMELLDNQISRLPKKFPSN